MLQGRPRLLVRALALCGAAALLAAPVGAQQSAPLEVDAVISATGGNAFLGKAEMQVFEATEARVNRTGGIRGRPIAFRVLDDATNPLTAVQLIQQIKAQRIPAFLGPGISATCGATLPLIASGPVSYCLSPAVHPPPGSYMFSATVSTGDLVPSLVRYAKRRGWTRLGVLLTSDATGQDIGHQIDVALASPEYAGMTIVDREQFAPTDISIAAQVAKLKAAAPNALMVGLTGAPFGTALRGLHEGGLDVPVFASAGNMTYAQMQQYADVLPHQLLFNAMRGLTPDPHAPPAVAAAQRAYFGAFRAMGIRPDFGDALAWDATQLVVDVLRHVGPDATPAQFRDYLDGLSGWAGICGTYDFRKYPQRGLGAEAAIIYRWDAARGEFAVAP